MYQPTLAIVENELETLEDLVHTFSSPPSNWGGEVGFPKFEVTTATTAKGVRDLIAEARRKRKTFDVMWFDLGLPIDDEHLDDDDSPAVGMEILKEIREADAKSPDWQVAGNIIVATARGRETILEDLLRTQIVQFYVRKPWDPENQQALDTVLDAYRSHHRRRWNDYRQNRLLRWSTEAARVGVSKIAQRVTDGVSASVEEIRNLTQVIEQNYHLNPSLDRENPVCQHIRRVQDAVAKIADDCASERQTLSFLETLPADDSLQTTIADLIDRSLDGVVSGKASNAIHVDVDRESLPKDQVHTSSSSALMVLEEVLYGAIEATPPDGRIQISAATSPNDWTATIVVKDQSAPLSTEECRLIELAVPTAKPGGRTWGLALAQYMALNVGARLSVESGDSGNQVTLHLPLAIQS